jgi:hypothetical protein
MFLSGNTDVDCGVHKVMFLIIKCGDEILSEIQGFLWIVLGEDSEQLFRA